MPSLRVAEKLGHQDTRATNLRIVLQMIWHSDGVSRADIARASGLTRATVSDMVNELTEDGLVEEIGRVTSGVGKPGTLVAVRASSRVIIAVDLRPTLVRGALIDMASSFVHRLEIPLDNGVGENAILAVEEAITRLSQSATSPILGIGVGTPGVVDLDGRVLLADHLDWHDLELGRRLADRFQMPVIVENDANAAALAEFSYGTLATMEATTPSLLVVRVGNGVGGGIVVDGHLYHGQGSASGEIGHIVVEPDGETCRCGNIGCLQAYVSRPLINKALADGRNPEQVAAHAGTWMGKALASAVTLLDIHHVVVSGVPAEIGEIFCDAALERVRKWTLPSLGEVVSIRPSTMGEDVILLGANVSVLSQELGVA